jgi:hypothetical protein
MARSDSHHASQTCASPSASEPRRPRTLRLLPSPGTDEPTSSTVENRLLDAMARSVLGAR